MEDSPLCPWCDGGGIVDCTEVILCTSVRVKLADFDFDVQIPCPMCICKGCNLRIDPEHYRMTGPYHTFCYEKEANDATAQGHSQGHANE